MPDPIPPAGDDAPDDVADASLLFHDEARTTPTPAPTARGPAVTAAAGGYDIEGGNPTPPTAAAPVPPVPPPPRAERPAPAARPTPVPEATVDPVWSRAAEWGPSLVLLAAVGLAILFLAYLASGNLALALAILTFGGLFWVLLTYPVVITLERPVRLTPEQAVNDYFGALAHHLPHYHRMWLLLSSAGKTSSEYGSFDGFQRYWKRRLQALRGDRVGGFTPLVFHIENFKAPKSAGQSTSEATCTVIIHARGEQSGPPLATIRYQTSLVRGPDNQWYLNRGTLPDAEVRPEKA
jgi:hypothetical protein